MPRRSRGIDDVDRTVGQRLRARRVELGLSQSVLAKRIGITFQQVQKYEKASNQMSVGRLLEIAHVLEVPMSYFLDGLEGGPDARADAAGDHEVVGTAVPSGQVRRLTRSFMHIEDHGVRRSIIDLVRALAGHEEENGPDDVTRSGDRGTSADAPAGTTTGATTRETVVSS